MRSARIGGKDCATKPEPFPLTPLGMLHSQRMNDLFVVKLRTKLVLWLCLSIQQSFACVWPESDSV